MLPFDKRATIDTRVLSDSRVEHFWDGERRVGAWFAEEIDGYSGVSWDIYYLYGPEAEWSSRPEPLIGSGATVIGDRDALEDRILHLLEDK